MAAKSVAAKVGDIEITETERLVLLLLVEGMTNKEIAKCHGVSPHTVADHLKSINEKTKLHNRTQVAVWAVRNGVV